MRSLCTAIALLAIVSFTPSPAQANILGLFGFDCCGEHNSCCGCGSQGNCGSCCEPACGCGSGDCCEPACGCGGCCEPTCGCGGGCYANGRQYAGQKFNCCCESHAPICPCVGRGGGCCQNGGGCCEPACGCGSCCEPACGCGSSCEPSCGCGSSCSSGGKRKCCLKNCGFCCGCGSLVNAFCKCTPCSGCSGEIYWSEWHNDPPYCQDPCNCHGDWIGPSGGSCNGGCGCDGGCSGGCGCNGGSNGSACGCDGGWVGAQNRPVSNGAAYAQQRPANRTQVANNNRPQQSMNNMRSAYANQKQNQSPPVRTASRPTNRTQSSNNSGAPSRPILW